MIPPLDMIEISSSSSHSSLAIWWDYLDYILDSDCSSAMDHSIATSVNRPVGRRYGQMRKKKVDTPEDKGRLSSTASNSRFGKK